MTAAAGTDPRWASSGGGPDQEHEYDYEYEHEYEQKTERRSRGADTGVEARDGPLTSLEPGMTASFVRALARRLQRYLTGTVPYACRVVGGGRLCCGKTEQDCTWKGGSVVKSARILSFAERGTGLDHVEAEFHPLGRAIIKRDWWRYPLWVSAFPCSFKVFRPASGRGSRQHAKWDFFRVNRLISSHFVSSIPTYLERAKRGSRTGARNVGGEIFQPCYYHVATSPRVRDGRYCCGLRNVIGGEGNFLRFNCQAKA